MASTVLVGSLAIKLEALLLADYDRYEEQERELVNAKKCFNRANKKVHSSRKYVAAPRWVQWTPPDRDWIKINFDGGYSHLYDCAIQAGIIRDHSGSTIMAFAERVKPGGTGNDGEAMALCKCLKYAAEMGYKKIWAEGDAKFLIGIVEGRRLLGNDFSEEVIREIRYWYHRFTYRKISFIHREGNEAANALVNTVRDDWSPKIMWVGEDLLPTDVSMIVTQEKTGCWYLRTNGVQDFSAFM